MNVDQSLHDVADRLEKIREHVVDPDTLAHIEAAQRSVAQARDCRGGGGEQPPKC